MQDLTVVFDLDGTLVETAPDLVHATNHVLGLKGIAPVDGALIRPSISFGARAMIQKALDIRAVPLSQAEIDGLLDKFLEHYSANIAAESRPYPGLEPALARLDAKGARLAVCTNKREGPARQLLDALRLSDRFAAITGRDTFEVHKPHPDHLRGAIRAAGGDPDRGIMIGDSDVDLRTARAAGLPMIGVPFGYTAVPMAELGPDALIEHYDELFDAVERLSFKGQM
ncbi:MAG: HAD-IA family hydrolase [Proteobacteria bacterium]|nr:HAD-IA family hydrolase [Pseudomonadota bacterium]